MLSDRTAKNAETKEKRYELRDSGGLVLDVTTKGVKTWRFRYRFNGKQYKLTLGQYPLVSLKEARELRDQAKLKIIIHRENPAKWGKYQFTFGELYEEFKKSQLKKQSAAYIKLYDERMKNHILPHHKNIQLEEITAREILQAVQLLESAGKTEQARRIKRMYGQIFRYGIVLGVCNNDPTYALRGILSPKSTQHLASITVPKEVGALMRAIAGYGSLIVRQAMLLHAYTFVRPGELRRAEWAEIDFAAVQWKIPAEKMKMGRIHLIPLSRQSLETLKTVQKYTGVGRYVFPSVRTSSRPMSDGTELAALRRMGYTTEEMCAHGFRGMASTLLHENGWSSDLIEKQLAHEVGNAVAQAYNHAQYLDRRTEMMQWWADYLDKLRDTV